MATPIRHYRSRFGAHPRSIELGPRALDLARLRVALRRRLPLTVGPDALAAVGTLACGVIAATLALCIVVGVPLGAATLARVLMAGSSVGALALIAAVVWGWGR